MDHPIPPPPDGEDLPWVKLFSHAFQGPGGWYIENSLTTIGGKDPVGELNRELWNSGTDANKDIVRKQSVNFPSTRTSMLFRTKPILRTRVRSSCTSSVRRSSTRSWKAQPEFEDETPINPFDFWQES